MSSKAKDHMRITCHLRIESHISLFYLEHRQLGKLTFNQRYLRRYPLMTSIFLTLQRLKRLLL